MRTLSLESWGHKAFQTGPVVQVSTGSAGVHAKAKLGRRLPTPCLAEYAVRSAQLSNSSCSFAAPQR